jgi:acetolactate synthase-1/2/3 large subunit
MNGAELLLKCLEEQGVDLVFGIPGGVVLPLYNELKKTTIKHILTRHEQGAAHAADGYARSTGKVGVCFSTSGPGATNLVTGLATAFMDSIPVVAISGQVAKPLLGKDSFQEADTLGITAPITKHNYTVRDANDLPQVIAEAFYIATQGRPGPVLIDIPKDVFTQEVKASPKGKVRQHIVKKLSKNPIENKQFLKAIETLEKAQRPLILAGGGVVMGGAHQLLTQLAVVNEIPVTVTLMGKGVFPPKNPLYLGMLGMHGTTAANWAVQNCDCLLAIGVRLDDRVTGTLDTFAPKAKIIHVDLDAAELGKNKKVDIPIVGGSFEFLQMAVQNLWGIKHQRKNWLREIKNNALDCIAEDTGALNPQEVFETINRHIDRDTIIVTDVGQHQMWSALFLHPEGPRNFLTSGGLGTMGFGLPAAIGAQMANPTKKVILITGDGSFQMNLQELAIVKQYNLPIKILIMNNGCLGMVRQWQELFFEGNYSQSALEVGPDWDKLAEAYGINGKKIDSYHEKDKILSNSLKSNDPWLLDIQIDSGANVFPMVPGGNSLDQMWGRWGNETQISSLG